MQLIKKLTSLLRLPTKDGGAVRTRGITLDDVSDSKLAKLHTKHTQKSEHHSTRGTSVTRSGVGHHAEGWLPKFRPGRIRNPLVSKFEPITHDVVPAHGAQTMPGETHHGQLTNAKHEPNKGVRSEEKAHSRKATSLFDLVGFQRKKHEHTPTLAPGFVFPQLQQFILATALTASVLGLFFLIRLQFVEESPQSVAYPSTLVRPNRTLSFQGRLTDVAQNPITGATDMAFRLYDTGPGTGGSLLWDSGACSVTPDQDGIFSTGLGEDCGSEITDDVFSENASVWLEVEVESETLTPRQHIKAVAYALNAETLQGYPATASAVENTVVVMNNAGQIVLGNATPVITATSPSGLTLNGEVLALTTNNGGNIILDPDSLGEVLVESNLGVAGTATVSGSLAVGYTSTPAGAGNAVFSGNVGIGTTTPTEKLTVVSAPNSLSMLQTNGTVALITWLGTNSAGFGTQTNSDLGFFTNDSGYHMTLTTGGNLGIGTETPSNKLAVISTTSPQFRIGYDNSTNYMTTGVSSSGAVTFNANGSSAGFAFSDGVNITGNLGVSGAYLDSGSSAGAPGYVLTSTGTGTAWMDVVTGVGGSNLWQETSAVLHPKNYSWLDLAIGGYSTASAKFRAEASTGNVVATGTITGTQLISTVGGGTPPLVVNSTAGVANLNADLLDGFHYDQLPYVEDATNATLVRTGAGPYTLELNLANANTWTGVQTFSVDTIFQGNGIWESTGNVGIGTTNPDYELDVDGQVRVTSLTPNMPVKSNADNVLVSGLIDLTTDVTGTLPVPNGGTGATTLTGVLKGNGTSPITAMTGTTNYVTRWTDANTIGIGTIFDNGTNVGIGTTTNLDRRLTVNGDLLLQGNNIADSGNTTRLTLGGTTTLTNTTTALSGTTTLTASSLATLTTSAAVSWGGLTSVVFTADNIAIHGSDNSNGDLTLRGTNHGTKTNSYVLLQDTGGNVGIGTTSAADFRLQVNGGIGPHTNNTHNLGSNSLRWSTVHATSFQQAGNSVCDTSGNCGVISWTSSNGAIHPLNITQDLLLGGTATSSARFAALNMNSGTPTASVSAGLAGGMFMTANGHLSTTARQNLTLGNSATFDTTGDILLQPNGTRRVGIGTATPTELLHIAGNLRLTGAFLDGTNSAGGSGQVLTSTVTGTDWVDASSLSVGDAGTLDGLDSSDFLRSNVSDAYTGTGTLDFMSGTTVDINGDLSIADTDIALDGASTNFTSSGNLSFNTNQLFINQSTGNIGVGTTAPSNFKLEIAGGVGPTTNDTYDLGSNSARWRDLFLGPDSLHIGTSTTDEGLISYNTSTNVLGFSTDATSNGDIAFFTDDLYLDKSTGRVGIGTTVPSQALHVAGNLGFTGALIANGDGGTNGYYLQSTGAGSAPIWADMSASLLPPGSTGQTLRYDGAAWAANDNIFDDGTNVGINDTTPTFRLDVNGTGRFTGNLTLGSLGAGSTNTVITHSSGVLQARSIDAKVWAGSLVDGSGSTNYLARWTDSDSLGIGVVYDNGTNVGIGTTTMRAALDIAGGASSSGTLSFRGTTDPKINILNGEHFGIQTSVGGDAGLLERLTILNDGNIGIGTTTPATTLHVFGGNATLRIGSTADAGLSYSNSSNDLYIGGDNGQDGNLYVKNLGGTATVHLNSAGDSYLAGGNVSIGTSSTPQAALDITASGDGTTLLRLSSERAWAFQQEGTGAATDLRLRNVFGPNKNFLIDTDGVTQWRSSDGSSVFMTMNQSTGNLGIGSVSPGSKLDLNGSLRITDGARNGINGSNDNIKFHTDRAPDDAAYEWLGFYSGTVRQGIILYDGAWSGCNNSIHEFCVVAEANNFLSLKSPATMATLINGGNVGIGTTNAATPSAKLQVYRSGIGAGEASIRIGNTANAGVSYTSADGNLYVGGDNSQDGNIFVKNIGGTNTVSLNSAGTSYFTGGNLGVLTSTANAAITVGGSSNIRVGDYVSLGRAPSNAATVLGNNVQAHPSTNNAMQIINSHATYAGSAIYLVGSDGITFHAAPAGSVTAGDTYSSPRVKISAGGNLGIATTNPGARLHVYRVGTGADEATVRIGNTADRGLSYSSDDANLIVGGDNNQAGNILLYNNVGTNTFVINSDAAVGNLGSIRIGNVANRGLAFSTDDGDLHIGGLNSQDGNIYVRNLGGTARINLDGAGDSWFLDNVGIGTTVTTAGTQLDLQISGSAGMRVASSGTGNTARFIAETSSTARQTLLELRRSGATTWGVGHFYAGGSANTRFSIGQSPDTSITTSVPAFTITTADNVGIGTYNPTALLHVDGNVLSSGSITAASGSITNTLTAGNLTTSGTIAAANGSITSTLTVGTGAVNAIAATTTTGTAIYGNAGTSGWGVRGRTTTGQYGVLGQIGTNAAGRYGVYCDATLCGGGAVWTNTSDGRLKENVTVIPNALNTVLNLRGVNFNWKSDGRADTGFIAQEVLEQFPLAVSYDPLRDVYSMSATSLVGLVVEAMKEQQTQIAALQNSATTSSLTLTDVGSVVIGSSSNDYAVTPVGGGPALTKIIGVAKGVIGKLYAGLVSTKDLVVSGTGQIASLSVNNLSVAGQSLQAYIEGVVNNMQLAGTTSLPQGTLVVEDLVATGSAELAEVSTESLTTETATVSGTLTTNELVAGKTSLGELLSTEVVVLGDATVSGNLTVAGDITASGSARLAALESKLAQFEHIQAQTATLYDATVSGTLYTSTIANLDNLITSSVQPTLLQQLIGYDPASTNSAQLLSQITGIDLGETLVLDPAALDNLPVDATLLGAHAGFFNQYLQVNGNFAVGGDTLMVGKTTWASGLEIDTQSLSYIPQALDECSAEYWDESWDDLTEEELLIVLEAHQGMCREHVTLKIQPTGSGALDLMDGLVTLADGKVVISGAVTFKQPVTIETTLLTDLVAPTDFDRPFQLQVAGIATESGEVKRSRFELIDELGAPVATISAEGVAQFKGEVTAKSLGLTGQADLTDEAGPEVETSAKTGKAVITAGSSQITIKASKTTADSLIFVTAQGSTNNQMLYVKSQSGDNSQTSENEAQFVAGFDSPVGLDVTFTWWIVN